MNKVWWKNAIVYQIYPRSFQDSNDDGFGDIPGITSRLDYLKDLGVDVIWLSPVYASPGADNGYDISDYKAINPMFGTMEDMDTLIAEAKKRDIRIIMDLVINHTSDEHEWFKKALAGDEKYRDYYIFKEGKNGKVPNNWGNFFGGECWEKVEGDTYYLHLFDKKQPDLNWHNPEVYEEVKDIVRFWLEKGIAGFRCDVINIIYKDTYEDGRARIALSGLEHYLSTEGNHKILRDLRKDVLNDFDTFMVGESVMVTPKIAHDLCDERRKELDEVFYFEHMGADDIFIKWFKIKYKPQRMIEILDKWQNELEWCANYLENHDQPRSTSRFGDTGKYREASSKMLGALNLCLRGTPFIYEGQEIGMLNGDFSGLEEIQDVESHTIDATMQKLHFSKKRRRKMILQTTRDHGRTPMQWSGEKNAGFTKGEPWLKINANHTFINVDLELRDPHSILSFYKKMIAFRKSSNALQWGSYKRLPAPKNVYAFRRDYKDGGIMESAVVVANMCGKPRRLTSAMHPTVPESCIGNYPLEEWDYNVLKPYEIRIIK